MSDDSLTASVNFALNTLKSLIMVNGGGVLAVLTFAGNHVNKEQVTMLLANAVDLYVWGLVTALTCNLLCYLAQEANSQDQKVLFEAARWPAVFLAIASLSLFALGSFSAANALRFQ